MLRIRKSLTWDLRQSSVNCVVNGVCFEGAEHPGSRHSFESNNKRASLSHANRETIWVCSFWWVIVSKHSTPVFWMIPNHWPNVLFLSLLEGMYLYVCSYIGANLTWTKWCSFGISCRWLSGSILQFWETRDNIAVQQYSHLCGPLDNSRSGYEVMWNGY